MRYTFTAAIALVVLLGFTGTAAAQSTRRPDLNLFKRGLRDPKQSLAVQGNLGLSFYDALGTRELPEGATALPDHGWGSFGSAALLYNVSLGRLNFDGSLGAYASYYPKSPDPLRTKWFPNAGVRTGYSWQLGRKTTARVNGAVRYRPVYAEFTGGTFGPSFDPFGGGGFGPELGAGGGDLNQVFLPSEAALSGGSYLAGIGQAGIDHELSRRFRLSGNYEYERDYAVGVEDPTNSFDSLWRQGADVGLHFRLASHLSLRGGYRYSEGHRSGVVYRSHSADFGVDYGDGLVIQLTRTMRLSLNGGMSGYVDASGTQHYRADGSAVLSQQIGRTWSSGLYYRRGVETGQLIFSEPVLSDAGGAFINGLVARQIGVHGALNAQGGALAFGSARRNFFRSGATAGIQTALGRHFALGADYFYFRYHFDSGITLTPGVPRKSANQGVYVSLSAWAPIFQRGGRNATR
jgi:hypothetical protein